LPVIHQLLETGSRRALSPPLEMKRGLRLPPLPGFRRPVLLAASLLLLTSSGSEALHLSTRGGSSSSSSASSLVLGSSSSSSSSNSKGGGSSSSSSSSSRQTAASDADPDAPSAFPVSRVVKLLEDMKASLEEEAKTDQEIYENMACWCKTNDKAKTTSIDDGEARILDLSDSIEKLTAESQTLQVQIAALEKEIEKNKDSLAKATSLREKQKAEFTEEEKEMVQSIRALDAAITVLSKHHTGAALLSAEAVVANVSKTIEFINRKGRGSLSQVAKAATTPTQQRTLAEFIQGARTRQLGKAAPYAAQSGEVYGILRQMKETFEADLSESQKEELKAQESFAELKTAKEAEIQSGEASLEDKQQQLAKADTNLAQSKVEREDTEATVAADKAFLSDLKVKCALTDKEWESRKAMRADEIAAVSEAIGILSSDDARDLFSKVFNAPSLLQLSSVDVQRQHLTSMLSAAAKDSSDLRLKRLAVSTKLDAFDRVKRAIDDLVAELKQEAEEESKHRDTCIEELNNNERWTNQEVHTKESLEAKVDSLHMQQMDLNRTITTLEEEVDHLNTEMERASEDREKEKAEFEATVADQKATQALLEQALAVLKSRYEAPALLQQQHGEGQAPPEDFREYKKSGHASGVIALLNHIIEDSVNLQKAAMAAESDAQDAYFKLQQATKDTIVAKQASITDRQAEKATVEEEIVTTKSELGDSMDELESLAHSKADLHQNCDFFLKNFDAREEARAQEIEALGQAKAYLSGMK